MHLELPSSQKGCLDPFWHLWKEVLLKLLHYLHLKWSLYLLRNLLQRLPLSKTFLCNFRKMFLKLFLYFPQFFLPFLMFHSLLQNLLFTGFTPFGERQFVPSLPFKYPTWPKGLTLKWFSYHFSWPQFTGLTLLPCYYLFQSFSPFSKMPTLLMGFTLKRDTLGGCPLFTGLTPREDQVFFLSRCLLYFTRRTLIQFLFSSIFPLRSLSYLFLFRAD